MATVEWRVDRKTKLRLDELVLRLQDVEPGSEEWYVISDEIRSLPGCPYGTSEEDDTILVVPVIDPRSGYTGPIVIARS